MRTDRRIDVLSYPLTDQAVIVLTGMIISAVLLFAVQLIGSVFGRWLRQFIDWFSLK